MVAIERRTTLLFPHLKFLSYAFPSFFMAWLWIAESISFLFALLLLYIRLNDQRLTRIPHRALAFSPTRCTLEDVHLTAARLLESPISIIDQIPPKTGRRYIVVGGVCIDFTSFAANL